VADRLELQEPKKIEEKGYGIDDAYQSDGLFNTAALFVFGPGYVCIETYESHCQTCDAVKKKCIIHFLYLFYCYCSLILLIKYFFLYYLTFLFFINVLEVILF